MRRGEIAAVASELDALLKYAVRWICDQERLNPDAEVREITGSSSIAKATAGQSVRVLAALGKRPAGGRPEVAVLCAESAKRLSRLDRFIDIRNQMAHDDSVPPGPEIVLPRLESLRLLVDNYRRVAGFDE